MSKDGFYTGHDYLALPRDPQPWIVRDLIPVGGAVNIYGQPKTGKSFAALGLAHAISTGQPYWLDPKFEVVKSGRVAYLQIDTPRGAWAKRLDTMREHDYDIGKIAFADTITAPYPFNILIPDQQEWLKEQIKQLNPIAVFVDTLREVHGGDENDSTVMKNVISLLVACCAPAALVLLSHSRKANQMNGDDMMNDARGSSYIAGRMDTIVKLTAKHLLYKGRSVGEGKLKVHQHPQTGLLIGGEGEDEVTMLCRLLIREFPDLSINALVKKAQEGMPDVSASTFTRRLSKLKNGE